MNLKNLRTQTRLKVGIQSTTVLANSAIDLQLNNGMYLLSSKIAGINEDFFEVQKNTVNMVANTSLYSLPSDCLKIKQVRLAYTTPDSEDDYKIATPYDPASIDSIEVEEESVSTSNPIVDITGTSYRIKPDPTSNVTSGIELYYIARPSSLVSTADIPTIQLDYHNLIADYAAREICTWVSKWDKYQIFNSIFEQGVEKMLKELKTRNINFPERFRNVLETTKKKLVTELWD